MPQERLALLSPDLLTDEHRHVYDAIVSGPVGEQSGIRDHFGSKAALFAAVLERAAIARASLDGLAAEFGSGSGLLTHVLTAPGHGRPGQHPADACTQHAAAQHGGAACDVLFADTAPLTAGARSPGPSAPRFKRSSLTWPT